MSFSYKLVEPPDGGWGAQIDDGWTGIIGQLVNKVFNILFPLRLLLTLPFLSNAFSRSVTLVHKSTRLLRDASYA